MGRALAYESENLDPGPRSMPALTSAQQMFVNKCATRWMILILSLPLMH